MAHEVLMAHDEVLEWMLQERDQVKYFKLWRICNDMYKRKMGKSMNEMDYNKQHTIEYYNNHAGTYDNDGEYPANKFRLELISGILDKLPKGKILDAGCGTGKFLEIATKKGFDCTGCDFSKGMLNKAKEIVPNVLFYQTSIDDLSMFDDNSFDYVFCLGVLPYIPEEQENKIYQELRRVIKKGGYFISAHQNELFDIFTFNKYTLRFYEKNIFSLVNIENAKEKLASLIMNPDKPINKNSENSARDIVFTKPENPILYPSKLAKYGFEHKEFLYYNFHCLPPLIRNADKKLIEISKEMEIKLAKEWQGMFMASTFINVAKAMQI